MSTKDSATARTLFSSRNSSQSDTRENEFDNSLTPAHLPPLRSPLNAIPDPSQYQKETLESELDYKQKLDAARASRLLEKRVEALDRAGSSYSTPKIFSRGGKLHSEPSSTQSTPAKSGPRLSLGGVAAAYTGPRGSHCNGGRVLNISSRVSRGIHVENSDFSVQCPHFELEEDASFWTDHNVQVLIRVRPLNNSEKVSQGYRRCLRQESPQTLVWLGHPETRFTFDHVACETISQEKLFGVAGLPMVENCLSGYNSCMFAYGQTGSGKTYTMMGEITDVEGKFSEDCGITPRIFEYLFAKIRADEESRRDEKLIYSCKCSFLEIYNEHITDLLEPSSANLQLREDMKKGVHVENLTEYKVRTVGDVVKLLLQGAANRKMAATHMNSESSRSHSVFTCNIESHWEKDSMNHVRFARLNLVDLAGSERQKSSGAEGERLKEAANINKSLSTLGLVIMSLVDLAHGKQRHIPYRDSRLTFLLQDSLGGNSKTTIIANVSPSICSASETLSTLKFAQRAKLIQNNAKVNEDASGDVTALQRQIQQLKDQLSFLMEHPIPPKSSLKGGSGFAASSSIGTQDEYYCPGERTLNNNNLLHDDMKKSSVGSMRRERIMDMEVQKLKAEIEQLNCLASEREADLKRTNMLLKQREEKIRRLEMLVEGKTSADKYLIEENKALTEEIKLLQGKIDNNRENQKFYAQGERETLLAENSNLRNQLLIALEGNSTIYLNSANQDMEDIERCRSMNCKLIREVEELRTELQRSLRCSQNTFSSIASPSQQDHEEFKKEEFSSLEVLPLRSDSKDEMASYIEADDESLQTGIGHSVTSPLDRQHSDIQKELTDARHLNEAFEAEQVHLIKELQHLQEENGRFKRMLENVGSGERSSANVSGHHSMQPERKRKDKIMEDTGDSRTDSIQATVEKIMQELEEVTSLNNRYQKERASQLSQQKQVDLVCEQVEVETARTILQLQEEVSAVQKELHEKLFARDQENLNLKRIVATKQEEIEAKNADWENAILELTNFLLDGSRSLKDADNHIANITRSFPQVNFWISDHVKKAATACIEKEETILMLQKNLENAQKTVMEMEKKISSLKGAAIALSEFQHLTDDERANTVTELKMELQEKTSKIGTLERVVKMRGHQIAEAAERTFAALLVVKWVSDHHDAAWKSNADSDIERVDPPKVGPTGKEIQNIPERKGDGDALWEENLPQAKLARSGAWESKNAVNSSVAEIDTFMAELQADTPKESDALRGSAQDIRREASALINLEDSRNYDTSKAHAVVSLSMKESELPKTELDVLSVLQSRQRLKEEGSEFSPEENIDGKFRNAGNFLIKFEEATTMMEEADLMLNELIKAHESAKGLTDIWKQTGEVMMVERKSLIEEVEQLKFSLNLKEGENELLVDTLHHVFVEIETPLSSLEGFFLQMQQDVDQIVKAMQADVLSLERDILDILQNSRSSAEDFRCEVMEKSFMLFVIYQCHLDHIIRKFPLSSSKCGINPSKQQEKHVALDAQSISSSDEDAPIFISKKALEETDPNETVKKCYIRDVDLGNHDSLFDNLSLKKELERKDVLLKGLLSDFRLLQESASNTKMKLDKTEKALLNLTEVRHELDTKTSQLEDMVFQHKNLEVRLAEKERDLTLSLSELEQGKKTMEILSDQTIELRTLLKDLYLKKSAVEEHLDEQKEIVKGLEEEILHLTSSMEEKVLRTVENIEDELKLVVRERDQLLEEVHSLSEKLEFACSLADENEAIAIEARQESETSKIYAEQKEEEVKILERSVEELEHTIDMLEKKVHEMDQDMERHRLIRDSLELEVQALRERLSTVENFTDATCGDQGFLKAHGKFTELHEAHRRIKVLEEEKVARDREIKQCKEYISELVLHAEAQASQYQQKYKALESMVHDVRTEVSSSTTVASSVDKNEKSIIRTRGSSSPFRCISSLVQQMNVEKDHELTAAKLRIQEVETLAASQQKEICMLSTRLAAAENMTHDVIRDLLGVKLDITNYANFIEQHQVPTLVETAFRQKEDLCAKEQEVLKLTKQINDLIEEKESCIMEANKKDADTLATQITLEQLQQRDQLLSAQNEMLKIEKSNLKRRLAELDEMVKTLIGTQTAQKPLRHMLKENSLPRVVPSEINKRLAQSQKLLSRVNNELDQYRSSSSISSQDRTYGHGPDTVKRRPKV